MAKQMRITIRQDGLLILRGRTSSRAWCPECRAHGEMITVDRATPIDSLDLHRLQASDGSFLICLKSLVACVTNKKPS